MLLLRTKVVFKFAVSLCFYLSFILFLKVVMTAANITKRLVKEKTIDWVNTTFPSKLMGWIVMTIKLVFRNCSDNLRFKPYLFSFLFLHFVGGWHKFWSQACQCLRFLSAFRDFIPGVYSLIKPVQDKKCENYTSIVLQNTHSLKPSSYLHTHHLDLESLSFDYCRCMKRLKKKLIL